MMLEIEEDDDKEFLTPDLSKINKLSAKEEFISGEGLRNETQKLKDTSISKENPTSQSELFYTGTAHVSVSTNQQNYKLGCLGIAVLGCESQLNFDMIAYDGKKKVVINSKISKTFIAQVCEENTISFDFANQKKQVFMRVDDLASFQLLLQTIVFIKAIQDSEFRIVSQSLTKVPEDPMIRDGIYEITINFSQAKNLNYKSFKNLKYSIINLKLTRDSIEIPKILLEEIIKMRTADVKYCILPSSSLTSASKVFKITENEGYLFMIINVRNFTDDNVNVTMSNEENKIRDFTNRMSKLGAFSLIPSTKQNDGVVTSDSELGTKDEKANKIPLDKIKTTPLETREVKESNVSTLPIGAQELDLNTKIDKILKILTCLSSDESTSNSNNSQDSYLNVVGNINRIYMENKAMKEEIANLKRTAGLENPVDKVLQSLENFYQRFSPPVTKSGTENTGSDKIFELTNKLRDSTNNEEDLAMKLQREKLHVSQLTEKYNALEKKYKEIYETHENCGKTYYNSIKGCLSEIALKLGEKQQWEANDVALVIRKIMKKAFVAVTNSKQEQ